jgi:hypothetical protein
MYIFICILCIHIYISMYTYISTNSYICIYIYIYLRLYVCKHNLYACMSIHIHKYLLIYLHMCINTIIYLYGDAHLNRIV